MAEALACGTLPIVNPVAGLAYRVRENSNGWHVRIADLAESAARLVEKLPEEHHRIRMCQEGRAEVLASRGAASVAAGTAGVYEEGSAREAG